MAHHEQYERDCPACGARISATAPKCINCGRYVDESEEEETEGEAGANNAWVFLGIIAVLVACGLAAYLLK